MAQNLKGVDKSFTPYNNQYYDKYFTKTQNNFRRLVLKLKTRYFAMWKKKRQDLKKGSYFFVKFCKTLGKLWQ